MRTIAFINAKGGVGKTTSALIVADILATKYNKKVLLIDLDPQLNTTKQMSDYKSGIKCVAHLLINAEDISDVISKTSIDNIDIIPCDKGLEIASQAVLTSNSSMMQLILKKQISKVRDLYDFCILDCPTAIKNICTLNGLAFTDDVIVPITIDGYSIEGIKDIISVVDDVSEYNDNIQLTGVFITQWQKNKLSKKIKDSLQEQIGDLLFNSHIRKTVKVSESTFDSSKSLVEYAKDSTAVQDYYSFIDEYLLKTKQNM